MIWMRRIKRAKLIQGSADFLVALAGISSASIMMMRRNSLTGGGPDGAMTPFHGEKGTETKGPRDH
jgi:hypothetical protein